MAKVSLQNVSASYAGGKDDNFVPVRGVTIDFPDREFVVLNGPRDSGKATILRLIAGLDEPASGEIFIGDKKMNGVAPKDREVAMVFRSYALYPQMSAKENIAFALKMRKFGQAEIEKRVGDAAAILGIEALLSKKPGALSAEEQLRVALAKALVRQPQIVLFDEPLANLGVSRRAILRGEIAKLHQRFETTMIYATRDVSDAISLADRVVIMRDGAVEQAEAPSAIYAAPANLFVAGFFGNPPMNLIHGMIRQERDAFFFRESGEGTIELRLAIADASSVRSFVGKPVVLGIRPEDLEITLPADSGAKSGGTFKALVDLVEPAGAGTMLYLQTGAHSLICRSRSQLIRQDSGRRMQFFMDFSRTHFFDPATGARIGTA